ncbi:unnamed protein product [Rotaria sp. Silwood2]|nr:unnamed protein product [Rotaria sp. Silwood2]
MKFQQIDTTHILVYEMIEQFTAILLQYCKEIDGIYDLFIKYKDNPPIFKDFPPIAGVIQWTRFLFTRIKLPMIKFHLNRVSISIDSLRSIVNKLKLYKEKCHLYQYVFDPIGTKKKIEIKYLINYGSNLKESLIECYYLEKLGFNLPESIIQIKLQYSNYEQLSNELCLMFEDYHLTIPSPDSVEVSLLQSYIDHIQIIIKPGTSRISFGEIGSLLTCREYFEFLENKRKEIILSLKRRYELIGPLLNKVKTLVFGTNTEKHKRMHPFYTYWEHEIFASLVELVIRNLCQFYENIFGTSSLFTADIILAPPRIKLQPPLEGIINSIRRSAHEISQLPKHFVRWLHGTCISCPVIPVIEENLESPDFTFYNDVKQHPDVY